MLVAVVLLLCVALAACGSPQRPPLSSACTAGPRPIERALAAAPRPVRLPDGTPVSDCVRNATSDADLQSAGIVLTTAAEDLADQAKRGDATAALRLGYLTGAIRRGAARTSGAAAELQRRVERAGAFVADDGGAAAGAAMQRGLAAGGEQRMTPLRLRLFHADDGARIAYREAGAGPALILAHSALLTHREFEPAVEHLTHRYRVVLPDLPLHGDSEDRPRHPYTLDWLSGVLAAFCVEAGGPRPLVGGHGLGAELLLRAVELGMLRPSKLVLMPNRLHRPSEHGVLSTAWRLPARAGAVPGIDRLLPRAARAAFRPAFGERLTARGEPAARDLVRHAFADVGGNPSLARSWARFARRWPSGARRELLDAYPAMDFPVLLLWADEDRLHPLKGAEEALDLLPRAQLRILSGTGFLIAYDDPVGVGRELAAFCG